MSATEGTANIVPPITIAVDFDGVLHQYRGWNQGIMGEPMLGARAAVKEMLEKGLEVVVFTTRRAKEVTAWLRQHEFPALEVTSEKRPYHVLLDDRAVRFTGEWTPDLVEQLRTFKPHWQR